MEEIISNVLISVNVTNAIMIIISAVITIYMNGKPFVSFCKSKDVLDRVVDRVMSKEISDEIHNSESRLATKYKRVALIPKIVSEMSRVHMMLDVITEVDFMRFIGVSDDDIEYVLKHSRPYVSMRVKRDILDMVVAGGLTVAVVGMFILIFIS